MRTVAQQRPAGWLTSGEGYCGSYLLGQREKDVYAGYGEQWIKPLEAVVEIIPNPLHAPIAAVKGGAVQLVNPRAFFQGMMTVTPSGTLHGAYPLLRRR